MFDGSRRLGSGNGLRFGLAGAAGVVEAAEVAEVADDAAALPDVPSALEPVELDRLPNPEPPNPEPPLKLLVGGLDLAGGCEPGRVDGVPNEADEAGGDDVAPDLEDAPPNEPRDVVPSEGRPSAVDRPMPDGQRRKRPMGASCSRFRRSMVVGLSVQGSRWGRLWNR